MKIKTQTKKFLLIAIFVLAIGFGFGKGERVEAADTINCSGVASSDMGECFCLGIPISDATSCENCKSTLSAPLYTAEKCFWKNTSKTVLGIPTEIKTKPADIKPNDVCGGTWSALTSGPGAWLNCFLLYILRFLVFLLSLSATLFGWIIKPENITSVISNSVVYESWTMVRDILNVSFIMFLLFSAFATVFQIDKYSYKKTLLTIVIMALLVNFSFPISRFIIDVSNMMMYYFIGALTIHDKAASASWFVDMTQSAGIADMLTAEISADTSYLLAAVVFVFILAVTFLTIAVLFVIRTIALAILIIFSSLAFIGAAIPPLAKYSGDWWNKLFSYCFFGPIMIFMLYVASSMMGTISRLGDGEMTRIAGENSATSEIIASYSFFAIPIVILWMGLGIAQSMSIHGAGAVVGQGRKLMNLPVKFGKWGGITLAKKAERGVANSKHFWWASPTVFKEGWKQRTKDLEERAFGPSKGRMRDRLNKLFEGTKTDYEQLEKDRLVATRAKEFKEISENSNVLLSQGAKLAGVDKESARRDWKAIVRILYSNRDQDELMGYIRNNFDKKILPGGKCFRDLEINEKELGVSGWNVNQAVRKILESCGEDEKQIDKLILDLGEIGAGNVGIGHGGASYDINGNIIHAENKWQQAKTAIGKLATIDEVQNLVKKIHRNNITSEIKDSDGDTEINAEFTEMVRSGILGNITNQVDRHSASFYQHIGKKESIKGMLKQIEKLATVGEDEWVTDSDGTNGRLEKNKTISPEQKAIAEKWVDALKYFVENGKKKP